MKNFLQVNRALVAEKKHLLFNQSFGTVGSPNQTDETLTRENRIGLMSYLRRTLMLLFAVLVMSIANIGMAWGAEVVLAADGTNKLKTWTNGNFSVAFTTSIDAQKTYVKLSANDTFVFSTTGSETITSIVIKSSNSSSLSSLATTTITIPNTSSDATKFTATTTSNVVTVTAKANCYIGTVTVNYTTGAGGGGSSSEKCMTFGKTSGDYKTNSTFTNGNFTIVTNEINWEDAHAKFGNNVDYISFSNPNGISAAKIYAKTANVRVTYSTATDGSTGTSQETISVSEADYTQKTLTVPTNTKYIKLDRVPSTSTYVNQVCLTEAASSCTAPNHVDISGDWDKFGGETISLTATAYSSAGTGSPIADGNITGWQWQKLVGSTWTNVTNGTADGVTTSGATTKNLQISNCGQGNSGKYRCVVSTGATCSTASATATDGSEGYVVKVYALECYTGGTTVYNFTRDGNNQRGSVSIALTASTGYEFKIHADKYYGNNGTINFDENNWTFTAAGNNVTVNSGLGGTFTFTIDYSSNGDVPVLAVTYPRKRIYLEPNSDWLSNSAKFAYYYFHKTGDDTDAEGWTDFLTADDCGRFADIPQWNEVKMIAVRFNSSKASTGNWDNKWNQTSDLTVTSNDLITITGWDNSQTYNSTYSIPTYTISYAKGTPAASIDGSKADETKTCGVAFTLPNSAVFTRTGYTQTGWTTSDGGAQEYALGGTYTTNEDKTFYPVWTVNNYDLTWNLGGGTTTSAGTGIASGVSSNTTTSQAFGTALTAPTVTKTGYNFSAWDPAVASTMPAANTTYTATWTAKTTAITLDKNGGDTDGSVSATYGSKDVSSLVHATRTGYTQNGYETSDHTLILKSDGTFDGTHAGYTESKTWVNESANVTLYARWTANKYDITYKDEGNVAYSGSNSGALPAKHTYGSATVLVDGVKEGYTFGGWYTSSDCSTGLVTSLGATAYTADITLYAKWTAAASLTALECNTLYKVEDMVPASITLSGTGQYGAGLSANTKFEVIGDPAEAGNAGGTPEMKNEAASFAEQSFTARMYLKGASNTTGSGTTFVPTSRAVKFIVSESGTLDIYAHRVDRLYLKKAGDSGTTQLGTSTSGNGSMVSHNVTAGTYYIYSVNSNTCVYGVRLNCCTTPAAPTAFSAGSITSTGATFSITDAGDAASYDIYYATSSTAPTASTPATTTSTSKTKAVTGLTASTTYYAWVRSVCDADHKSAWVALSGSSFTTTSTPAELTAIEANVLYQAADMANITFTGSDQWFAGLSTNAKFKTYGDGSSTSAKGKTVSSTSITDDIDTKNFTSIAYIMTADNTSSTSDPTKGAIEFITPSSAGDLYLYFENTSSALTLKKKGTSTSLSLSGAKYKKIAVEANTHYFINGASSNRGLYGIKFIADVTAPTFVSSVPANGATGVATSGTIVLTFSEALGNVDASKFTLTGATKDAVAIDGSDATKVNITYSGAANSATVTLATAAAAVSDVAGNALAAELSNISFTTAAAAPATKDIYYGAITITAGALTKGSTGTSQFFTNIGGTIANNTEISWSSGPGTGGEYYESNVLTDTELSKSGNWNTSSGSNRYVGGMKFQSGSTYTLALGSKVASSITFYGRNGSASKTMTVGGEDWTSSATKNTFAKHEFIKTGGFTGDVSITQDGDFYGILVITIQTATPCTTPVIPALSNQTVCPGSDIAAWNATQTAVLADGETASYSWKKKGNDTELANTATFDLGSSAAESQAGTYVVTVTVSKAGKASATATKEVTLTVTAAVEEPVITANKATVYPGNSVTLTATCGTDGVTWNWYLCANADGTGAGSSLGTSSSYTIASAGAAGTYYYKAVATGDGTHSCGAAEYVYTLTVTAASECEKYFWFVYAADAASNGVVNNRDNFFGSSPKTGSSNSSTYKFTLDGTEYTATRNTGDNTFYISFTVPEGSTATLALNCKGSSSKPIYLIPTSGDPVLITDNSSNAAHVVENIAAGTYKVGAKTDASASWTLAGMAVQVCTASSCTDATPTITAANTTVCVGSELSISSTGYETGATFQWQKLNNSTSTWDNISGATSATYTVATAAAEHAGSYRLVATKGCARTSNTVTISVPSAPNFGSTVPASVSIMQTIALSINTVEATDAVKYKWYKSADDTWDAGDTEIGTNKELIKAYDGEAIGTPSYYIFCRAQNACGITTSSAIAVNVTAYVEEDCATRGNEGDAEFGFEYSAGQATYNSTACWSMNDNSKKLIYAAPDGKYFKTMKVTIASSKANKASYRWSTNGGTSYTEVAINSINTTLMEKTIDVSTHGNVNALQIGRNLDGKGESSGTLYVSKICFEYTDACTATTVTPSTSSVNYEMGGEWSNPTFTLSVVGTLTYSSSNEDIASVDDDGTVTFNGEAGTVTITASYAGNATDCASEGSYTINVSCPGGAPKVVASGTTVGCNSSITLQAKQSDETSDFADGTYQWFRNGEEIDGETSSSYTATQAGTYTVSRTKDGCTSPSSNSAVVTSETTEPEVERLVPFQYYHVDKEDYSDQMKMRHLFAVKNSGKLDGKSFKMYVSRNGGAATDVTSSNALVVWPNGDGHVDTVMVDLNKLSGKYSVNDELVFTCKAIDCDGNVSNVYKNTITMRVIGATPTLALICSGSNKASGTRKTSELTVGGDFLTGYNVADLCQQTGGTSFDANTEWGLYTDLKANYIVTPVNGYAVFNKLNYEPFDILLLTDYPKASKSDAAKDVLDDMAALCDYRPMLSFKTHMVAKSPSKWAAKGFTTSATENKADGRLNLNIVCYAHPMFEHLKSGTNVYRDADNSSELVYTMLSGTGYEGSKGMQGFEIDAAENFVTIGLTHYNASAAPNTPSTGNLRWTPDTGDRMLVTVAERQANIEARFILFSINCGAQSKLTPKGEEVILACLEYLLDADPLHVADCSFTFDNGANAPHDKDWYKVPANCPGCTGELGDGKWSTQANWGPDRINLPGEFTSARIAAPVNVDMEHAKAMELRIINEGSIDIPAGKALDVKSTIRRMDGSEIYPTEESDIHIGSGASGNGTLIFNNNSGDTKARVDMYSKGYIDGEGVKNYQYIGTPFVEINALYNYYGSWIYSWGTKKNGNLGWVVVKNGGPMTAWTGYCITQEAPTYHQMSGTLTATGTVDITVPANANMVVGNSWTAPIDINALTTDDLEGLTANIYFFNTGVDKTGTAGAAGSRYAGSTYVTVPVDAARYEGEDDHINSLQGFFVKNPNGSAGTLHLDYERHVRKTTRDNILSDEMHAPARRTAFSSDEPTVLKIKVSGENYDDKLLLLEREDFTEGFDNGWDGDKWDGNESALYIYTTDNNGTENSVSAIPELEGTVIGFRAGEDDAYTLNFEYLNSDEPLYLYDVENNTYTQIMTGMTYRFFTTDNEKHERFIITRSNGQEVATGVEPVSGSLDRSKAKKLLIEDKMFIMVNGMLYDATGKVVK